MIATPAALNVPLYTDEHDRIRVSGTRVLLELVIHAFRRGETAEGIVDSYPTLKLSDVYAVIAYYLENRTEVDDYVRQSDERAEQVIREIVADYTPEQRAHRTEFIALLEARRAGN